MARVMRKDPSHAWRAVLVWRTRDADVENITYIGPYWRKSDATGQLTTARNSMGKSWSYRVFVRGHVEAAPLGEWVRFADR